jgi:hypothetical protein
MVTYGVGGDSWWLAAQELIFADSSAAAAAAAGANLTAETRCVIPKLSLERALMEC